MCLKQRIKFQYTVFAIGIQRQLPDLVAYWVHKFRVNVDPQRFDHRIVECSFIESEFKNGYDTRSVWFDLLSIDSADSFVTEAELF